MTPIDDIRVGMWIAVCGNKHNSDACDFLGKPMEVLAVSLPWLCVTGPRSIDLRCWEVQRVTPQYVRAMQGAKYRRKQRPVDDPSRCPRCHYSPMVRKWTSNGL